MAAMDGQLITTATVVVLCAAAGVRAYLPLLAMGIAAALGVVPLQPGYEWLTNPVVLAVLGALAAVEFLADKVPGVDHVNDAVHTVVRPLAGALIFATSNNIVSENSLPAAVVLGLGLAGGTHAVKAAARPAVTTMTAGLGNPVVSLVEDAGTAGLVVLALVVPLVALVLLVGFVAAGVLGALWLRERRRRRALERQAAMRPPPPPPAWPARQSSSE